MAEGRERRADGAAVVAGIAAHREVFVGGTPPVDALAAAQWPVRVYLANDGGTLLKAEATGPDGKPITLFEVTRLVFGATGGKPIEPPTGCTSGNSMMDDSGEITAHAEMTNQVVVSGSANFGSSSTTPVTASAASVAANDVVDSVTVSVTPVTIQATKGE